MKASFKPRARLLKLLGDQLIGTPQLAIFELVKNSYDADAEKVEIIITNPETPAKATIEVTDFGGTGMDIDTIQNIWLEPGADHKDKQRQQDNRTKKHKRLPLGEKGVGRFAVHKLGKKIHLITRAKGKDEVELKIDWRMLEEHKYIEDAKIDITVNKTPTIFTDSPGTKIIISELNEPLYRADIRKLHRNIQSIRSPFESGVFKSNIEESNFEVILRVPQRPTWLEYPLDIPAIVSNALFKFHFTIGEDGIWSWCYEFNPNEGLKKEYGIESVEKSADDERFEATDELKKIIENEVDLFKSGGLFKSEDLFKNLGTISGEIYVFDFRNEVKKFYSEANNIRGFLDKNKGVRIYRDGIRVYNYGEPQDDWLQMDRNRIKRYGEKISRTLAIGAISLDLEKTPDLIEKTNREGFIENKTYDFLRAVVQSAIGKFESLRVHDIENLIVATKTDTKTSITQIENPIQELKVLARKEKLPKKVFLAIERIEKGYNEMRDIMLTAGMAGLNMSVAFHEIYKGITDTRKLIEHKKDISLVLKQFERFEVLLDTYANLLRQEKSRNVKISSTLSGNISLAGVRFKMHDINHSCPVLAGKQPDYIVKAPPNLITSAINNVIDNAIYWLDQKWGTESDKKYLYIGVSDEFDKGPAIVIADNGPGWRHISPEEIVKPFLTTRPEGMGLGMYYTDTVMERLGGELVILTPDRVKVPKKADGAVVALVFNGGERCEK